MGTRTSESGFTLVELMIASMITLVVMGVAFSTFRDALALNDAVVQLGESSQNLRAGTNLLVRDLLQAGRNIPTGGIAIPSGPNATPILRPGPPNSGFFFENDDEDETTLAAITTGAGFGPVISGLPTDIITILADDPYLDELKLYPSNAGTNRATLAADGSSFSVGPHMHWIVGNKPNAIPPLIKGDLIYFANPNGSALQTVTEVNESTVYFAPNDPFNLNQRNAGSGSITEILPDPCEDIPTCQAGTRIRRVYMYTYYVHTEPGENPRLMRKMNHFDAQALAGVIEDLDLSYDLVDGTNNPTDVKELPYTANQVTYKANQIRKVNVHVGVRSELISVRANDYVRNHLSTVVSLRNLAYVDRYDTTEEEDHH